MCSVPAGWTTPEQLAGVAKQDSAGRSSSWRDWAKRAIVCAGWRRAGMNPAAHGLGLCTGLSNCVALFLRAAAKALVSRPRGSTAPPRSRFPFRLGRHAPPNSPPAPRRPYWLAPFEKSCRACQTGMPGLRSPDPPLHSISHSCAPPRPRPGNKGDLHPPLPPPTTPHTDVASPSAALGAVRCIAMNPAPRRLAPRYSACLAPPTWVRSAPPLVGACVTI